MVLILAHRHPFDLFVRNRNNHLQVLRGAPHTFSQRYFSSFLLFIFSLAERKNEQQTECSVLCCRRQSSALRGDHVTRVIYPSYALAYRMRSSPSADRFFSSC